MTPFDTPQTLVMLWAVIGYAMGSVPFGLLLSRLLGLGDLRTIGSGNIGATNVLRTGNKTAALLTLLLDAGKGTAAVLLARALTADDVAESGAQIAGLMAIIGHCFPVNRSFKGGKGMATFLGVALGLCWPVGLACCLTWLATAKILKISSLSALVATASSLIWLAVFEQPQMLTVFVILVLLVFERHRDNIVRLKAGTEPKIGQ